MARQSIVQNLISRLGQSQDQRLPPELAPDFAPVDARSGVDLLDQARRLAGRVSFYANNPDSPSGHWGDFFPPGDDAALLAREDGGVPPHLGLFGAFLALYEEPRAALNDLTRRHLDFQFQRVLRFTPRPAEPDHAHLLLELKKGAAPFAVTPEHVFAAGKDAAGRGLFYRPVRDTVVGQGKVVARHSVFRDAGGVRFAPVADSADGLGAPLDAAQPNWPAFGHAGLPPAPLGCALASPVLALAGGKRRIAVDLQLGRLDPAKHSGEGLARAFSAFLSGPKGWLGPFALGGTLSAAVLSLEFTLAEGDPAVVGYDPAVHGLALATTAPVVQLLLAPEAAADYADLAGLAVDKAAIRVEVQGLTTLALENDNGSLNPKKAFQPFGPQPVVGSRFLIGCPEALSKTLDDLAVHLHWQGAPADLYAWYADYANRSRMSNGVSATLVYQDRSGQGRSVSLDLMARDSAGVSTLSPSAPPVGPESPLGEDDRLFGLLAGGSAVARWLGKRFKLARPMYRRAVVPAPAPRSGFVTVALADDFLHADYRKEAVHHAVSQDKVTLNEPYTPTVAGISLDYRARSARVDLQSGEEGFAGLEVQFFHVGAFGQRREHGFLRRQFPYLADQTVGLLPAYPDEGEFIVGLTGVGPGDSLSLLLQVAPGSADPEAEPRPVRWSVLCDNYWRPAAPRELAIDTSRSLRASGIVSLVLPGETTTDNTWLPAGAVWLKASVDKGSRAACQLVEVAANAVEVRFEDRGNDPRHLADALPAGSIAKLLAPPPALKQVAQPYASQGGRQQESDAMLVRRAAERLRHRQRCVTPWDYERLLLEAYPAVHQVKCIPHASETSWFAPGSVLLVVVPDLRNRNAVDPLQPKVDLDTLTRMAETVRRHCGQQVAVGVRNPRYQPVRLDFKVRFRAGLSFNYYRQQLHDALLQSLSPWAFEAGRQLAFGGRLYRSVLLDFVEELPYVDFVTDFRFGLAGPGATLVADVAELTADRPDAILVSAAAHTITEVADS